MRAVFAECRFFTILSLLVLLKSWYPIGKEKDFYEKNDPSAIRENG